MSRTQIHSNAGGGEMRRMQSGTSQQLQDFGKTATNGVRSLRESLAVSIQRRPIQAVLIALGLGCFYGRFRRSPIEVVLLSVGAGFLSGLVLSKDQSAGTSKDGLSSSTEKQQT